MRHNTTPEVGLEHHDERSHPALHNKRDDDIVARKIGVATLAPPNDLLTILHYLQFI